MYSHSIQSWYWKRDSYLPDHSQALHKAPLRHKGGKEEGGSYIPHRGRSHHHSHHNHQNVDRRGPTASSLHILPDHAHLCPAHHHHHHQRSVPVASLFSLPPAQGNNISHFITFCRDEKWFENYTKLHFKGPSWIQGFLAYTLKQLQLYNIRHCVQMKKIDLCSFHIVECLFSALVNAVFTLVCHKDEATTLLGHFVSYQGNLLNL